MPKPCVAAELTATIVHFRTRSGRVAYEAARSAEFSAATIMRLTDELGLTDAMFGPRGKAPVASWLDGDLSLVDDEAGRGVVPVDVPDEWRVQPVAE